MLYRDATKLLHWEWVFMFVLSSMFHYVAILLCATGITNCKRETLSIWLGVSTQKLLHKLIGEKQIIAQQRTKMNIDENMTLVWREACFHGFTLVIKFACDANRIKTKAKVKLLQF